ncbi:MAG: MBL fold metallo-hydrolase [Clostridiales bacterium]|nr:MBL fold metallo-hydrolase [Clostridiales bacterium]
MLLRTLASGSSGNSVLIQSGSSAVLVDAGISCRKITQRLRDCGLTPGDLNGILVTHEHTDHIAGLGVLMKHCNVPIYASGGTCAALVRKYPVTQNHLMLVPAGTCFDLAGLTVTSFPTPHDAADSVGYRVSDGKRSAAVATDLGRATDYIRSVLTGTDLVLLESNHDVASLRSGPYPYYLQERILSDIGHLCNEAAAELAVYLARQGTGTLVLGHLSKENNTPELAYSVVQKALQREGLSPRLGLAPRDELSQIYEA